jgi:hypothetical protein
VVVIFFTVAFRGDEGAFAAAFVLELLRAAVPAAVLVSSVAAVDLFTGVFLTADCRVAGLAVPVVVDRADGFAGAFFAEAFVAAWVAGAFLAVVLVAVLVAVVLAAAVFVAAAFFAGAFLAAVFEVVVLAALFLVVLPDLVAGAFFALVFVAGVATALYLRRAWRRLG